jgi:hypothetical protein
MTHSMGSIVLDEYVTEHRLDGGPPGAALFDNVVICSSASAAKTHAAWCGRLTFARRVYVTVNRHDPVLRAAGMGKVAGRLGKKLHTTVAGDVELAPGVAYIDLSKAGVTSHRYFLSGMQRADSTVGMFLGQAMTGRPVDWAVFGGSVERENRRGAVIYHLKAN